MSTHTPSTPPEQRAWAALQAVEDHPQVRRWLAEADALVAADHRSRGSRVRQWHWAAAVLIVLTFTAGAYWRWAPAHYQTGFGEQRDVTLSDGSRVTLNTDTALTVRYSKGRRFLKLARGEALFSVKHDAMRPFEVAAGGTLTRALGTEFNVDMRRSRVTVSVLDGAVSVVPSDSSGAPAATPAADRKAGAASSPPMTALSKGQAVEFSKDGQMRPHQADVRRIDAWRTRRLEFTDTPLAEAIEEFNRYATHRVVLGSPELASVRVSGVFRIGDADGFLYSLREALQLEIHETSGEAIVMKPTPVEIKEDRTNN